MSSSTKSPSWFGVRCIFNVEDVGTYEERITIWKANDFAEAISLAETEALEYAAIFEGVHYAGLAQAYRIADQLEHGTEVFSLMRDSTLGDEEYLSTFFDAGAERQGEV